MGHHLGMQTPTPVRSSPVPSSGTAMADWPQREHLDLHDELHARPATAVRSPGVVSYWIQHQMDAEQALQALGLLCEHLGLPAPAAQARHHVLCCPEFDLKFERHGEFISWQLGAALPAPPGLRDDAGLAQILSTAAALHHLPAAFVQAISATPMLAGAHVLLLKAPDSQWRQRCCDLMAQDLAATGTQGDAAAVLASRISDDLATVLTSLRLGHDGFVRFVLLDHGLPPDRAARNVQRLCEIEAYRMLAMLGFPVARTEGSALNQIEASLQHIVDDMANERTLDDATAFDTLLRLSAEIEHSAARTRYRLSATRAYQSIVQARLAGLREERVEGLQKLSDFFSRRFAPAMALCESTDARITDIAERINRAVDLARVRVEARREANNQELLRSLAHRQKLQLRLQQTVEGLSVVAISYYALSIVAYATKAVDGMKLPGGIELQYEVITALAVVPVVALVYRMVSRVRRRLEP